MRPQSCFFGFFHPVLYISVILYEKCRPILLEKCRQPYLTIVLSQLTTVLYGTQAQSTDPPVRPPENHTHATHATNATKEK